MAEVIAGTRPQWIEPGHALESLQTLPDGCVRSCVTSPPYWRQRIYGSGPDEIGLEETPELWAAALLPVFDAAWRVTTHDGSLWLNVGDKFAAGGFGGGGYASTRKNWQGTSNQTGFRRAPAGYKPKDLTLAPFLLAEQLRTAGWYLRQTIIWQKVSAVEPPRLDRPSTSHEYLFLFSKSYDSAVRDPGEPWWQSTVWQIAHDGSGAHPAQMPLELARRCIVASTRPGEIVLDPFSGFGTTCLAANRVGRRAIGLELNREYVEASRQRIRDDSPMFHDVPLGAAS